MPCPRISSALSQALEDDFAVFRSRVGLEVEAKAKTSSPSWWWNGDGVSGEVRRGADTGDHVSFPVLLALGVAGGLVLSSAWRERRGREEREEREEEGVRPLPPSPSHEAGGRGEEEAAEEEPRREGGEGEGEGGRSDPTPHEERAQLMLEEEEERKRLLPFY